MLIPARDLNQYQALLTTARTQAIKMYMWNGGRGRTSQMIPQIFLPISDISSLTQNIHLFHSCTLNNNKNLLYLECIHVVFHQVFAHSIPSVSVWSNPGHHSRTTSHVLPPSWIWSLPFNILFITIWILISFLLKCKLPEVFIFLYPLIVFVLHARHFVSEINKT